MIKGFEVLFKERLFVCLNVCFVKQNKMKIRFVFKKNVELFCLSYLKLNIVNHLNTIVTFNFFL